MAEAQRVTQRQKGIGFTNYQRVFGGERGGVWTHTKRERWDNTMMSDNSQEQIGVWMRTKRNRHINVDTETSDRYKSL